LRYPQVDLTQLYGAHDTEKFRLNRALFLDRDGVVNVERNYVHSNEAFQFQDGIFDLCWAAQSLGYLLIVVTNQAGIARGYYTEADFHRLTDWMIQQFAEKQIRIAAVYYAPTHPVHGIGPYKVDSPDRKPGPGMLLRAQADFDLDLAASVLVGDRSSDIRAAEAAGVATRILLRSEVSAGEGLEECFFTDTLEEVRVRFFPAILDDEAGK
jgi:D-glycero-D-manno-heptose 1,7-bisphosphate phosphatase